MIRNYNFHYNEGQGNVLGWAVSFNTFFNKRLCSLLRKKEEEEKEKKNFVWHDRPDASIIQV